MVTSGRLVIEARNIGQREIVSYTGVSGNDITGVTRGIGGTTAVPHSRNALVEMNLTAEDLADALAVPSNLVQRFDEAMPNFVQSGLVITMLTGLNIAVSSGVIYVDGYRVVVAAVASQTLPASKDVYVDVNVSGVISFNPVNNNVASPALAANSIRLGKVPTAAASVTRVQQLGYDSLGNRFYNTVTVTTPGMFWNTAGLPQFPPTTDLVTIMAKFHKPKDIMTVGSTQIVRVQPYVRPSGTGDVVIYRTAYLMRTGAAYVALEPTSFVTVGETTNYQTIAMTIDQTYNSYYATYDLAAYAFDSILRFDLHRDGAAAGDNNPDNLDLEGVAMFYNKDYGKSY